MLSQSGRRHSFMGDVSFVRDDEIRTQVRDMRAHPRAGLSVNLFVYLTVLFQYKSLGPAGANMLAFDRVISSLFSLLPPYKNSDLAERFGSHGKSKTLMYGSFFQPHRARARACLRSRKNRFIIVDRRRLLLRATPGTQTKRKRETYTIVA